jgi:2-polyprenyl-3-methyl-5-hydroxy-6-metoxy-1,4-benzoquinol methylase
MTSPLDQEWPEQDLERVHACPYCGSNERTLAFKDVQDWSFHCAPGKWNYWDCINCQSLYLDPRPTLSSIGAAYAKYYTHSNGEPASFLHAMKARLRNECLSQTLNANIEPRLHIPKVLNGIIALIAKRVLMPFGWMTLANHPKGRFMDVGCGAGMTVAMAQQLGWNSMGLEIDPAAVRTAQQRGLNIVEGTYEQLTHYEHQFDCIMCHHVLEHVHDPLDMLAKLNLALKPGGMLLLALPNSLSALRRHFGADWRGLEAPRHLAIPSQPQLIRLLTECGFSMQSISDDGVETAAESYRIQRRGSSISRQDLVMARQLEDQPLATTAANDFIKLICEACAAPGA